MNSFTKTYLASGTEKYLQVEHEMRHGHRPGWNPEEIYRFADFVVKKGTSPLRFKRTSKENKLRFEGEIIEAAAYYTCDTADWGANAYKWIKIEVEISNKTITTNLPEEAEYYFVNGVTPDKMMYSSEMVKVRK